MPEGNFWDDEYSYANRLVLNARRPLVVRWMRMRTVVNRWYRLPVHLEISGDLLSKRGQVDGLLLKLGKVLKAKTPSIFALLTRLDPGERSLYQPAGSILGG